MHRQFKSALHRLTLVSGAIYWTNGYTIFDGRILMRSHLMNINYMVLVAYLPNKNSEKLKQMFLFAVDISLNDVQTHSICHLDIHTFYNIFDRNEPKQHFLIAVHFIFDARRMMPTLCINVVTTKDANKSEHKISTIFPN